MKIRSRRRVINLGSGNDDGGKKDRAMRGVVEVVVQGQIEINLRGLCKGRWNNSESGAARSYKLANKRRPHNSASCNGYKWRFSSPPASSPSPLRSTYLELNEETEKERETIIDEKKIGKHKRDYRPIREAESIESFLFTQTPGVSAPLSPGSLTGVHEFSFFLIVVRTCKCWSKALRTRYIYRMHRNYFLE